MTNGLNIAVLSLLERESFLKVVFLFLRLVQVQILQIRVGKIENFRVSSIPVII